MPLKLKETNISNEHNRLKNPNWREADQLAIYKHDRGVELWTRVHQETTPAKWSEWDLNPWPLDVESGALLNHSATLPPDSFHAGTHKKKLIIHEYNYSSFKTHHILSETLRHHEDTYDNKS